MVARPCWNSRGIARARCEGIGGSGSNPLSAYWARPDRAKYPGVLSRRYERTEEGATSPISADTCSVIWATDAPVGRDCKTWMIASRTSPGRLRLGLLVFIHCIIDVQTSNVKSCFVLVSARRKLGVASLSEGHAHIQGPTTLQMHPRRFTPLLRFGNRASARRFIRRLRPQRRLAFCYPACHG